MTAAMWASLAAVMASSSCALSLAVMLAAAAAAAVAAVAATTDKRTCKYDGNQQVAKAYLNCAGHSHGVRTALLLFILHEAMYVLNKARFVHMAEANKAHGS
jgi:hypothetical protein